VNRPQADPLRSAVRALALCVSLSGAAVGQGKTAGPPAGEPGGPGLAIRCAKALVCPPDATAEQVVNRALVLVKDGKIERVVPQRDAVVPEGYSELDVGPLWLMPGLVELHAHVGGTFDINDMVYLANPELRASTSAIPGNDLLRMAVAGGVTTILFIPGSGTNIGGQGCSSRRAWSTTRTR
jgi:imidazolonepropionase-like amidohydrolase